MLFTINPSSVGIKFFFSLTTYSLLNNVDIVGTYVDGLPIPFSSKSLTKEASVYLAGGCVKCCFPSIDAGSKTSPSSNSGNNTSLSSSSVL